MLPGDEYRIEMLSELINIGAGRAAGMLNSLTGRHISLGVTRAGMPGAEDSTPATAAEAACSFVKIRFQGELSGCGFFIIPSVSVPQLATAFAGGESMGGDTSGVSDAALQELGNILLNSVIGTLGNLTGLNLTFTAPVCGEGSKTEIIELSGQPESAAGILARTSFTIEDPVIACEFVICFGAGTLETLTRYENDYKKGKE